MICALYTLMKKYREKDIYLWNVNADSINVFMMAACRHIDIQGFVTAQAEYVGEKYMNRPVVTLEQALQNERSIILVSDEVSQETMNKLPKDRAVYWSDALAFNDELRSVKVIVYGTGRGAEKFCKALEEEGVEAELYCLTKRGSVGQYRGKTVIEAAELDNYKDYAVVIAANVKKYRWEILENLSGFQGRIFVEMEHRIGTADLIGNVDLLNFIQNIDYAAKEQKRIYLYSRRNAVARLIEEVLSIYGIKITGYVGETEIHEQDIQSIYGLAYEGTEDKLIIISEEFPEKFVEARENIELAGFSLEERNYTGFQCHTRSKGMMLSKWHYYKDPLLGGSIIYPEGKPGWKLYGKEEDGAVRIMVLGGSTSSEQYHPENWISKLYYKLCQDNIKAVIYNGAHSGNDVVDEILRLLRDGYALKPQIVISMSGVNNTSYKDCTNQFNEINLIQWVQTLSPDSIYCSGVESDEPLYSFWSRNIKILKLIAEFYGADFFGFLQPMNITMSHMSLWEKSRYELEGHAEASRDFMEHAKSCDDYRNLMQLFEHQDEMYIDMVHYTDLAHEAIADKVYETVMPAIQNMG